MGPQVLRSIDIPEELYRLLESIARRRGMSVDEVVLEYLIRDQDPEIRIETYMKLHDRYIKEAEELYSRGDILQAGEKY